MFEGSIDGLKKRGTANVCSFLDITRGESAIKRKSDSGSIAFLQLHVLHTLTHSQCRMLLMLTMAGDSLNGPKDGNARLRGVSRAFYPPTKMAHGLTTTT